MKYILLATAIIFVYAAFSLIRVFVIYSAANNPTIAQNPQNLGQGQALRYIAAGDSTAVGEGASSAEKTYTAKLFNYFAQTHQVEYKNVAKVGATSDELINEQLQQIIDFNPDIVTVSIGANDRTHLKSSSAILRNYKTIINELTNKTEARIYMTNMPNFENARILPKTYRRFLEYRSAKLNPEVLKLENERVKIVDIHNFGWDNYPDIQVTFAKDQFHPNDEGYNNWTNAFLKKIQE